LSFKMLLVFEAKCSQMNNGKDVEWSSSEDISKASESSPKVFLRFIQIRGSRYFLYCWWFNISASSTQHMFDLSFHSLRQLRFLFGLFVSFIPREEWHVMRI
jgi:hypothetical protein